MTLYTPQEVADMLRVTDTTVRRLIVRGSLPAFQLPGNRGLYRIRKEDLEAFVQPNQKPQPVPRWQDPHFLRCSARVQNFMTKMDWTWEDFTKCTKDEAMKFRQVGRKSVQEIEDALHAQGLTWFKV